MKEWWQMGKIDEENKILIPDFTLNKKNSKKTIARAKKLIEEDIMKSLERETIMSLNNLYGMVDEVETNKKRSK
jgi:hypothetical protein